jgi:hypothetical protein
MDGSTSDGSGTDGSTSDGSGMDGSPSDNSGMVEAVPFSEDFQTDSSPASGDDSPLKPGFMVKGMDVKKLDGDIQLAIVALKKNDPDAAIAYVHPEAVEHYREIFKSRPERLEKIAALLETRKPVFVTPDYAEYEVTDNGKTYTVIFEKVGENWLLTQL